MTQPSNEQSEPLLTKTAGDAILRSILAGPRATSADDQDPSIHVPAFSRFIKGPPEFFFWP
ncbi:MAG: hypothetical protein AAGF11_18075 [Myxococcota bacterium]